MTIQEINQALADSFGLQKPEGALVAKVEPGTPAERAGLKAGDVIRAVDGKLIVSSGDLPAQIAMMRSGDTVKLDVWRKGQDTTLSAQLASDAEKEKTQALAASGQQGKIGLALRPLEPQEREQAGVGAGLLVEQASGPAKQAGVKTGDLVLSINGVPTKSVDDARKAVDVADKSAALLIQRGGNRIFVPVRIG